ncbi:MAG: PIG-L family deacetylase [Acidimicrobiales bacterium]|nr:PIG-L family deacetylase [Acidimicrobiales bacterium]
MSKQLTLMAVCPHPDDECTSAGAALALYGAQGIRTVVVTCTNGEFGDGPGGIKPGDDGHDEQAVAETRLAELKESCRILGVTHSETLGYRDSGMSEWDFKGHPDAFCNVPVEQSTARLLELMEKYEPDVVIADADNSGYDHPDHVRGHDVALAAVTQSGIPSKLYYPAFGSKIFESMRNALVDAGVELPADFEMDEAGRAAMAVLDARITTVIDASVHAEQVHTALHAHASQIAESWFSQIPLPAFAAAFGHGNYIRAYDTTGAPVPETDLFAGLR